MARSMAGSMAGSGQQARPGPAPRSYARVVVTSVFTLALVAAEFGLLHGVYHRADPVRQQLVIEARLSGQVSAADEAIRSLTGPADDAIRSLAGTPADPVRTVETGAVVGQTVHNTDIALAALAQAGLKPDDLDRLATARTNLSAVPSDLTRLTALNTEARRLEHTLTARRHTLDLEADLIYGSLLFLVSVGWFLWFKKLVGRHRALQQAVTEQAALASSEQRLLALVQNGSDVVMVLDLDSTTSFVSPSARPVLGMGADELLGTRMVDLIHPDDVHLLNQQLASQRAGEDESVTLRMRHADGRTIVVEGILTNLLADPTVGGFVLTVRDVTERHALEERLTYQAFHDSLTGLANRQLFGDRLAHALLKRAGIAQPLVVLFCDLDDFKDVNDSLGHGVGDEVLEVIGQRIRAAVRAGDTAARLGGDEFAVLMEATELAEAEQFAQRLVEIVCEPMTVDGTALTVTASVGMAQAVPGEITSEEALRNADVAMYSAKDHGKSTVAAYDSGLHAEALDRLELRADLQRALRDGELVLYYQPTVELDTGKITGFEALVRWQHPTRGLLSPYFFIPMAEETGMIVQLGTWVLYEACRTAALLQADWRRPTMAVNISSQQLIRPDFVDQVTHALAESGLPADRLTLEITESVVLQDLYDVIPRLSALRARGPGWRSTTSAPATARWPISPNCRWTCSRWTSRSSTGWPWTSREPR